jgi:hypothetical protein
MNNNKAVTFQAELKQVDTKKLASLDMSHKVVLNTDDKAVLKLAELPPDTMFTVAVAWEGA